LSTRATAGFNVFIELSVVHVVPHMIADRLTATEPAHESLPGTVTRFMPDCWQGMRRAQMTARAKRRGLRLSFRASAPCPSGETGVFGLNPGETSGYASTMVQSDA